MLSTLNNNLSRSVAKRALWEDVHGRDTIPYSFTLLPVSRLAAEALSLNTGPIAKMVALLPETQNDGKVGSKLKNPEVIL